MKSMDHSIAQLGAETREPTAPAWKTVLCVVSAYLLAAVMLLAGIWKMTNPIEAATRMNQALVPAALSFPAAVGFGITETLAGLMLLIPRFRRWGGMLSAALLVAFMVYIGIFYTRLVGEECNCFPWIQRAVGPLFFVSDGVMLLWALAAWFWAKPSRGIRPALLMLAVICVFSAVSATIAVNRPVGLEAPESILVDGQPFNLHDGRVLLYFFDPECTHCLFAARDMTEYKWREDVKIIFVPTDRKWLADQFLDAAGWEAPVTSDSEKLREVFKFGDPPFAAAIVDGHQVAAMTVFEGDEPKATLGDAGFIGN